MHWTIATVLLVLWVLGLVSSCTMGGSIHLLLIAAVVTGALAPHIGVPDSFLTTNEFPNEERTNP